MLIFIRGEITYYKMQYIRYVKINFYLKKNYLTCINN